MFLGARRRLEEASAERARLCARLEDAYGSAEQLAALVRTQEAQGAAAHPNPDVLDPSSCSASRRTSDDAASAAAAATLRSELEELRCSGERERAAAAAALVAARGEAAERACEVEALAALSLRGDATVQECMARLRVTPRMLVALPWAAIPFWMLLLPLLDQ